MACSCCTSVVTQAKLDTLVSRGTLETGKSYEIKGTGITLTAISGSEFDSFATRTMLVPKTYKVESLDGNAWEGVWHISKTVSSGDLMIWGGLVWKNLTGAIGTATDDITLDAVNWIVIPKNSFSNSEYIERNFKIIYDYANSWISKQWDDRGNEFGISYEAYQEWKDFTNVYVAYNFKANPVDISDWNYGDTLMSNNKVIGIWNNVEGATITGNEFFGYIADNKVTGELRDNHLWKWGLSIVRIYNNTCTSIVSNTCAEIQNNSNTGIIFGNNMVGSIFDNTAPCVHIRNNSGSCDRIKGNSNSGSIWYNNMVGGSIDDNTNTGNIELNVSGNIYSNSCGRIGHNICGGQIYSNSNTACNIYNNITTDSIYSNANDGDIESNFIIGGIFGNSNRAIYQNNSGWIHTNSGGNANIFYNKNNGWINNNVMGDFDIHHNTNNGNIAGATLVADITDPIVNK